MIRLFHRVLLPNWREDWLLFCPITRTVTPPVDYAARALALGGAAPRCQRCGAALVAR